MEKINVRFLIDVSSFYECNILLKFVYEMCMTNSELIF
jgi:hypothetical protein